MLIYRQVLFVCVVLLFGGYYGQVAPLYPAQSDLTSGSLVAAAGSIGIVALAASAAMAVRAEQKNINCEQKLQTQEQSFDHLSEGKEEVEKQLKEAIGELQRNKDDIMACKTPGYFLHPVLGCIGIQDHIMRSNGQWVDKCAEDGGKLILIDSAAKEQALANILEHFRNTIAIQGKRETLSGPWMTEDGQLLPYTGEFVNPTSSESRIIFRPDGKWEIVKESSPQHTAVCEIRI